MHARQFPRMGWQIGQISLVCSPVDVDGAIIREVTSKLVDVLPSRRGVKALRCHAQARRPKLRDTLSHLIDVLILDI